MFTQPYFIAFNLFNFRNIRNLKIGYNAGYDTIPGNIKRCVYEAVMYIYNKSGLNPKSILGIKSSVDAGNTISYYNISDEHKRELDKYVKTIV